MTRIVDEGSPDDGICSSFALTPEDVATYFSLAREVSGYEFDQDAMILPCRYRGTIRLSGHVYRWEIFPAGAGYLYDDTANKRFICTGKCLDALPNLR